ncbi:LysR family transcriptional regulator [Spirulina sp. CCNP1310]|uniref:LysR family transcriptional regulator n=1 Tax=Spirulina sp. CCNP1310 TaxID=3110249 RepID=UPI002B1F3FCE|nr:LysR family transcriptional regulator [Spirulina sp. CCNP1310]MEA5419217.1 LysR family transcriptional regulator [Spirulina sp. CCNP1310]
MKIDQLRIFLAVAEHLHFTKAADSLYLSQPAVSSAIQSLEKKYAVKLFHRIGQRIEPTDAGNLLQVEAQKILNQVELTEQGLRELNNLQRGELKIGSSLTVGNYWLPQKISQFKQTYPGISIQCTLANTEEILTGTAGGMFDLGLVTGNIKPVLSKSLDISVIGHDMVSIVVGRSHLWFDRDHIALQELTNSTWVMREPGSGSRDIVEQSMQTWGINPQDLKVGLVLMSSEMIKSVVEEGIGATALPRSIVRRELELGTLKAIPVVDVIAAPKRIYKITQPVILLRHQKRFITKISKVFEELLIDKSS